MQNSNNNAPKIGTPEYDAAMIAKFRAQGRKEEMPGAGDGRQMGVETSVPHGSEDPFNGGHRMGLSVRAPKHVDPAFGRGRLDPGQLLDMRAEIDRLYSELRDVSHRDRTTGEPVYRYQGAIREGRERQLVMLESQLPLLEEAIARQEAERGDPAENTLAKLSAEKDRQDALRERAEQVAFEREAEAMADRQDGKA